jgi:hypothetical protein
MEVTAGAEVVMPGYEVAPLGREGWTVDAGVQVCTGTCALDLAMWGLCWGFFWFFA